MASPSMVQRSGDTLIVRSVVSGDRLYLDGGEQSTCVSQASLEPIDSDSLLTEEYRNEETDDLPLSKVRRSYECSICHYYSQNPRHYLSHLRDVHGIKMKIHECPHCIYASKHFQKLVRHMKMVHSANNNEITTKVFNSLKRKLKEPSPKIDEDESKMSDTDTAVRSDDEIEKEMEEFNSPSEKKTKIEMKCSLCNFTATSHNQLSRHERKEHLKTKLFPCSKCNYVTHIKARFTKHVKYHSMPMIKCEVCDFRTPYKWNLDRHMKNHGGSGAFCCSACNFTADIKQSLTVHEMNHHVPPVGSTAGANAGGSLAPIRRRNRVGGSDSQVGGSYTPRQRHRTRLHPRNKLKTIHVPVNDDLDLVEELQDNLDEINITNVETPKSNRDNLENMCEINDTRRTDDDCSTDFIKFDNISESSKPDWGEEVQNSESQKVQIKKTPRPIPNLIPLNQQAPSHIVKNSSCNIPLNLTMMANINFPKKDPDKSNAQNYDDNMDYAHFEYFPTKEIDESSQQCFPTMAKYVVKKKNSSIFDKLYKERLMTSSNENNNLICKDCGHASKSISEHSIHERICSGSDQKYIQPNVLSGLRSTRCQNCRHRCKTSLDLVVHMQTCLLTNRVRASPENIVKVDDTDIFMHPVSEEDASVDDSRDPHPMENVVFVWNSILQKSKSFENSLSSNLSNKAVDNCNSPSNKFTTSTPINDDITKGKETTASGKKVFKCPHCSFWASTASRFHVHIVGHLNKKPFECSLCSYKSNWRWDITKHIRLKSVRDPDHSKARVLMTDETGRRNYSKYNKYLTLMQVSDPSADVGASGSRKNREMIRVVPDEIDGDMQPTSIPENAKNSNSTDISNKSRQKLDGFKISTVEEKIDGKKTKRSLWKCKKCDYRNTSKDALLMHVRKHSKSSIVQSRQEKQADVKNTSEVTATSDVSSISYRCGHCNQVSNWKHVIQRHCRLKHNGDIKVVMGTKGTCDRTSPLNDYKNISYVMKCSKCPFSTTVKHHYESHVKQHTITAESSYKCFICPYYVKSESELMQHLPLHGISEPEKYGTQVVNYKSMTDNVQLKRYKCSDCPYESNSKSQFTYHEQFHKAHNAPFKCEVCNYQVTKRHLLHQHMKVHGFNISQIVGIDSSIHHIDVTSDNSSFKSIITPIQKNINVNDTQLMWVSFCGEFQKMYKCRSCPYVNLRKNNIFDHEKMHVKNTSTNTENIHKCSECNYNCNNLDVFLSHIKVHKDDYAKIFCPVNSSKSDEEQLRELKEAVMKKNNDKLIINISPDIFKKNNSLEKNKECEKKVYYSKMLHFCSNCPARFLFEKELLIHLKFHVNGLPYKCRACSYTAKHHTHLLAHNNAHTKEYQDKTKELQTLHATHPEYLQPKILPVIIGVNRSDPVWIVVVETVSNQKILEPNELVNINITDIAPKHSSKQYECNQCPAKFFKSAALNYHLTLHGGQGHYKCRQCNYAVKTIGNLAKHEAVHGRFESQTDYETGDDFSCKNIPLSGTDLYQQKTKAEKRALSEKLITRPNDHFPPVLQADPQFGLLMHGNPDFIYPTYLKNGRPKEKRYKCHKCPSAFEKREQYKVHLSLHGSKQRYKCEICDYSVKYYANYVQHMRKHQMNADAQAARQSLSKENKPSDDILLQTKSDTKFAIKSLPKQSCKDYSNLSVSDQQTLKLLQRRLSNSSVKDLADERKIYRCTCCPYTNHRRDALDNHMRRHISISGINNNFTCPYCDYAAPQLQFLKDHMKIHFHLPKYINPDYFTNFDSLEIFINQINDDLDESKKSIKKQLFIAKEKLKYIFNIDESDTKIYVIPKSGEKIMN